MVYTHTYLYIHQPQKTKFLFIWISNFILTLALDKFITVVQFSDEMLKIHHFILKKKEFRYSCKKDYLML